MQESCWNIAITHKVVGVCEGVGKILKRDEFEKKKKEIEEARKNKGISQPKVRQSVQVAATGECRSGLHT